MKEILFNIGLLIQSIIIVEFYRSHINKKYGFLSSISASAKPLQKEGGIILFYMFIVLGVCEPLAFISNSLVTTIAAMLLSGIGIITGYNPNIKNNKWENGLHILFTNAAILLFVVGILMWSWWYLVPVLVCLAYGLPLYIKKVPGHTRLIEYAVIYLVWACLLFEKILIPLVKHIAQ